MTSKRQLEDDHLDRLFSALADRTRRALLAQLSAGDSSVSVLAEPHEMSLQAVLKHLGILEVAGLVTVEKTGRVKNCHFNPDQLAKASDWVNYYQRFWPGQLQSLGEYLERREKE